MSIVQSIEHKLRQALAPSQLTIRNESHLHNVPAGAESHLKVIIVAATFAGQPLVQRHRRIHQLLAEELTGTVHAFGLHTLTPEEWQARSGRIPESPPCLGGKFTESPTPI